MNELNILIGDGVRESDKELFFGKLLETDEFFELKDDATWVDIAILAGLFPSKGQARKNGYDIPIAEGFTDTVGSNPISKKKSGIGKKNTRVVILKITEDV